MTKTTGGVTSVFKLLANESRGFVVPEYQSEYSWMESECERLWNDLWTFAFPHGNPGEYGDDEPYHPYFAGNVVFSSNRHETGKLKAIICGHQLLISLALLLRAFHAKNGAGDDGLKERIERCIWLSDRKKGILRGKAKLILKMTVDESVSEFNDVINTGVVPEKSRSHYAISYRCFQRKIDAIASTRHFHVFVERILDICVVNAITTGSRWSAIQVSRTQERQGQSLTDADVFKSVFYRVFDEAGKKEYFAAAWATLDDLGSRAFPKSASPLSELLDQYAYVKYAERWKEDNLIDDEIAFQSVSLNNPDMSDFTSISNLASFWRSIEERAPTDFSSDVQRHLFVLDYAPTTMWRHLVSAWFMANCNANKRTVVDLGAFAEFLRKIAAFILAHAVMSPGTDSMRSPIYQETANIAISRKCKFSGCQFYWNKLSLALDANPFWDSRLLTRAMLAWWTMHDPKQQVPKRNSTFHIEQIYSPISAEEQPLAEPGLIDSIGNMFLLEGDINIPANVYKFSEKRLYYNGDICGGRKTSIRELLAVSGRSDFSESDIKCRQHAIHQAFINELLELDLLLQV